MAAPRTLDTDLRQCLIDFFEDEDGLFWHHRLLLARVTGSQWIAATPDHDVALLNLSNHRVIPLGRNTAFPAHHVNETYAFDKLADGEEALLLDQARALADFLGAIDGAADDDSSSAWRVADTAHEEFGEIVPQEALVVVANVVIRGDWGLVLIDEEWTSMNRVRNDVVEDWRLDKTARAGGDPRVLPMKIIDDEAATRVAKVAGAPKAARKVRVLVRSQAEAVRAWSRVRPPYYSLEGPPALTEFFEGLEEAGLTLNSHNVQWVRSSGVSEHSAPARSHRTYCEILRHLLFIDQLDGGQILGAELLVREIIKVETAVGRNPKCPDWEGLDFISGNRLTDTGAVEVRGFNQWLSTTQKDHAFILKQGRLLREERAVADKDKRSGGGGGNDGGGNGNKKKKDANQAAPGGPAAK